MIRKIGCPVDSQRVGSPWANATGKENCMRMRAKKPADAFKLLAIALVAILVLSPSDTAAQRYREGYGGFGSASASGDIARGEGMWFAGLGQFNLSTAMASSINVDTSIRWNQYVYRSIEQDLHNKHLHRMARKDRNNALYRKSLERIFEQPTQSDLRSGDALNFVLMQLLDPRISPSSFRRTEVSLTGDVIRKIPFHYAQRAATFSIERMIGKREWPLVLRNEAFAQQRKDYERAVDTVIELGVEKELTVNAVLELERSITAFSQRVDEIVAPSHSDDHRQASQHLKGLREIPRMLNERPIERVIAEIETYSGTSVGDLLGFMQRHNLRFGVADSPVERELYATLFQSLLWQREKLAASLSPLEDSKDFGVRPFGNDAP